MAGRRLLDAAKLFGASRSIAKHHLTIRSQQWDVLTQTSTLARAVKSQTDRVTVTARAAYALARRVNEKPPSYTSESTGYQTQAYQDETTIPRQETVRGSGSSHDSDQGLKQDHHYKRSEQNAVAEDAPKDDLHVLQEKAGRHPLPDGTIPPKGSPIGADIGSPASKQGGDTFAQRPVSEAIKEPLHEQSDLDVTQNKPESEKSTISTPASSSYHNRDIQRQSEFQIPSLSGSEEKTPTAGQDTYNDRPEVTSPELSSLPRMKIPTTEADSQGGDEHVQDGQMNQDVYYSPKRNVRQPPIPSQEAVPEQDEVPEGINTDVFHSPHVAALLKSGGKEDRRKAYEMRMRAAKSTPIDRTSLAQGRNQDTFNVRESTPEPAQPAIAPAAESKLKETEQDIRELADSLAQDATTAPEAAAADSPSTPYQLRESRVPSSRFGRLWQYGGLATSMAFGAVGESLRRVTGGESTGSLMLSPANMERLVAKLSRMRGAALKLGQMMSFQDSKMLPPAIHAVLQRVQDSADYMPPSQRNKVLAANLGADWKDLFTSFDDVPVAAASIGQVHRAVLASTGEQRQHNLGSKQSLPPPDRLPSPPPGLYLDKTIANAQVELGWECDYIREAQSAQRFHTLMLDETTTFTVPRIIPSASGPQVLTAEWMTGTAVTKLPSLSQHDRDWIGTQILRLCLRELMEWRFMQTDPNWTNFLYNPGSGTDPSTRRLELLDFGASREFSEAFVTPYINLLVAASTRDREAIHALSVELGYLTGAESPAMRTAHIDSILVLAEPFIGTTGAGTGVGSGVGTGSGTGAGTAEETYDFKNQTITDRVREKIGLMVKERLAPPPEETYSLHRKLSGAFLLCARLGSRVPARRLFEDAVAGWRERGLNGR
ncbi:hypothetical protein BDV97DRAFT_416527 [Delphinella strobiligena]|nr:hypothetical protein BDV97DRAFT_416527 [Delphinella strobiligena]